MIRIGVYQSGFNYVIVERTSMWTVVPLRDGVTELRARLMGPATAISLRRPSGGVKPTQRRKARRVVQRPDDAMTTSNAINVKALFGPGWIS